VVNVRLTEPGCCILAIVKAFVGMLQLLEISTNQYYFLPWILPNEVDDALVFGEALCAELSHGAQDEYFVIGSFRAG